MVRKMSMLKAREVISEYRKEKYNASKALVNVGYAKDTATKNSKKIINNALKIVADNEINKTVSDSSLSPRSKILQLVGMSEDELFSEYMYIVKQNKDLTNKLKALQPLLATQGIKWNEEQQNIAPTLNLTVKTNKIEDNIIDTDSNNIVESMETNNIDVNNMAQQSHENNSVAQYTLSTKDSDTVEDNNNEGQEDMGEKVLEDMGGGVDLSFIGVKEGESHSPKNMENNTIDILNI